MQPLAHRPHIAGGLFDPCEVAFVDAAFGGGCFHLRVSLFGFAGGFVR
jgi:hypothetical protein